MNTYQIIEEYREPLESLNQFQVDKKAEMSDSDHGFLCGLIKKHRPKKLVEVGISAGGTSTVLLNCIQKLGLSTEMYSVDLSETYYRDSAKPAGYLIGEASAYGVDVKNHRLLLGKVVAARLEEIGSEIDFLVLDTTHALPGEILDFLAIFPYLKKDAVVVLHDLTHSFYANYPAYATSILFHSVVADKFLNNAAEYPNIAAFQLNEDTPKYIMDVFAGLVMPWFYMPSGSALEDYDRALSNHYPAECLNLYYQAKSYNNYYILRNRGQKITCVSLSKDDIDVATPNID